MTFTSIHHVGMVPSDLDAARDLFCNRSGLSVDEHRAPWPESSEGAVTRVEFPVDEMYY